MATAGQIMESMGGTETWPTTSGARMAEKASESVAARLVDWGSEGAWAESHGRMASEAGGGRRIQRRGEEMDAVARIRGVQEDAGDGSGAVGELGALVARKLVGGGVVGEDDGEAAGGEGGLEMVGEGDGGVFFEGIFSQFCAGVGTAVRGIEQDKVGVVGSLWRFAPRLARSRWRGWRREPEVRSGRER